ncbi:MAG: cellulase family glycosylhydrolase [Lentisphaeria bacterium]|nr:MAG: cellulase family glycosylhydrolase [Lentisphaeria bacterium]
MDWIRVSRKNPHYFEHENGDTFLPVGVNLCFQRFLQTDEECLAAYRRQIVAFAQNGGNFIRVWMGVPFLQLEPEHPGLFSEHKLANLHALVDIAKANNVRIKFTLEHFRRLDAGPDAELFPGAASFENPVYRKDNGGFADDMTEFMSSDAGRKHFIGKLELLSRHFSEEPAVMAWELWNEVNTVSAPRAIWQEWSQIMLQELHRCFPHQLCLQNLGSFDAPRQVDPYRWLCTLDGCDYSQAHRYLDPGAELDVCRGPMDLLCRDVIEELRRNNPARPAILAETGAVESRHSRPSRLYDVDTHGMLLHDGIFAPSSPAPPDADSSGTGISSIWSATTSGSISIGSSRRRQDLTRFSRRQLRFSRPIGCVRQYGLLGKFHTLLWLRDAQSTWESELARGRTPDVRERVKLDLRSLPGGAFRQARCYLPWTDASIHMELHGTEMELPEFTRSMVLLLNR